MNGDGADGLRGACRIDSTGYLSLSGLPRGGEKGEDRRHEAVAVLLLCHRDIQAQRCDAKGYTAIAQPCLASSTEDFHIYAEDKAIAQARSFKVFKRYAHGENALFIGRDGVEGEPGRINFVIPPEVGIGELVVPCDAGVAHRHAVVAQGLSREGDAVLRPLQGGCRVHRHLEGGTLVFFNTEGGADSVICLDAVVAGQSALGQGKVGCENAHGISGHLLSAHFLPVGIAQEELIFLIFHDSSLPVVLRIDNSADVNRLSGPVDGAVGVKLQRCRLEVVAEGDIGAPQALLGKIGVIALEDAKIHPAAFERAAHTSLRIGLAGGYAETLIGGVLNLIKFHGGILYRMSALCIHDNHL